MNDPVIRALREIVPVTRGGLNLGGRTLRWVESLVAEAILGFSR